MYLFYFALSRQNINFINWEYLQKEYRINDTVNNKTLVSDYVYGTNGSICGVGFFFAFPVLNFKLKIFDPFRFGNIKIDQISVLKLSLG